MKRFRATDKYICNLSALKATRILADIYTRFDDIIKQFIGI